MAFNLDDTKRFLGFFYYPPQHGIQTNLSSNHIELLAKCNTN